MLAVASAPALPAVAALALLAVPPVPIPTLYPRTGASRSNPGPEPGLGLPEAEHRAGSLNQDLHLHLVLGHAQAIQGAFLRFVERGSRSLDPLHAHFLLFFLALRVPAVPGGVVRPPLERPAGGRFSLVAGSSDAFLRPRRPTFFFAEEAGFAAFRFLEPFEPRVPDPPWSGASSSIF